MIVCKPKNYNMPFTSLSNALLRDTRISDGAYRLLVFLLTQGRDYRPSEAALAKRFGVTARTISKRVSELKETGHLRLEVFRYPDKKSEIHWIVSEFPMHIEENTAGKPP